MKRITHNLIEITVFLASVFLCVWFAVRPFVHWSPKGCAPYVETAIELTGSFIFLLSIGYAGFLAESWNKVHKKEKLRRDQLTFHEQIVLEQSVRMRVANFLHSILFP